MLRGTRRPRPRKGIVAALGGALALIVVVGAAAQLVSSAAAAHDAARHAQARLDGELHHAERDLGIPVVMLEPIQTQERHIVASEGIWASANRSAETEFTRLYPQVV
ncbi:MAG: hypothetical protein ACRDHP_01330, partial [Ktedonobacterales bacterium]